MALFPFGKKKEEAVVVASSEELEVPKPLKPVQILESDPITRKRKYKAELVNGCWLEMEFTSYTNSRSVSAMIFQSRDRWLIIRFESIPNLLIDAAIIESMMIRGAEIMKMDNDYLTQKPDEFIDDAGERWIKVQK